MERLAGDLVAGLSSAGDFPPKATGHIRTSQQPEPSEPCFLGGGGGFQGGVLARGEILNNWGHARTSCNHSFCVFVQSLLIES